MPAGAPENGTMTNEDGSNGAQARILVVDDHAPSAEMLAEILTLEGHEVRMAHTAVEAVEVARSFAPGIAVLDMGRGDSLALWQLRPDEVGAPPDMASTFPVFEATDAAAQRTELIARGVATSELRDLSRLRSFTFWDLDGNRLEACQLIEPTEP